MTLIAGSIPMKRLLTAAAAAAILAGCTDNNATAQTQLPPVVQMLEKQGLKIHGPLDAPGGLEAFAASAGSQAMAVYLTPDKQYALIGTLLDAQGNPVVEDQLRQLVSQPMEESAWATLEAARWVRDGNPNAERIVYTFTDANCPFCNQFWQAARPWVEAGKVQIRHIMVGIIKADSPGKAAAILGADNPEAAFTLNEQNHANGGIEPLKTILPEIGAVLEQNLNVMRELGFTGTPGIIGKAADGSLIRQNGAPRGAALEALLGPL